MKLYALFSMLLISACFVDNSPINDKFVGSWAHVNGKGSYSQYDCSNSDFNKVSEGELEVIKILKYDNSYWTFHDGPGLEFEFKPLNDDTLVSAGQQNATNNFYGNIKQISQQEASLFFSQAEPGYLQLYSSGELSFDVGHQNNEVVCSYSNYNILKKID